MACPRTDSCRFEEVIATREARRVWQSFYCEGMHARCERFKLFEAGRAVPTRLLPNGRLQDEPTVTPPPAKAVAAARR
jgi:hypothetical protein